MRKRQAVRLTSISLALAAAVAPVGCSRKDGSAGGHATTATAPPATGLLEARRASLEEAYRVKPDVRFVNAFSLVEAIVSGAPAREATATFASGHWTVQLGADPVATLSELPSFAEEITALAA